MYSACLIAHIMGKKYLQPTDNEKIAHCIVLISTTDTDQNFSNQIKRQ